MDASRSVSDATGVARRLRLAATDVRAGARLLRRLPAFLRRPITAEMARATWRDRLER
jgi:hypothetical protein